MALKVNLKRNMGNDAPIISDRPISYINLRSNSEKPLIIRPGEYFGIPIGISIEIPPGYHGLIVPKDFGNELGGLYVFGGLITSKMKGEIRVHAQNIGRFDIRVNRKDLVAQLILMPTTEIQIQEV